MVAAGERSDEAGGVFLPLHRYRSQLQTGNPAFGAPCKSRDVFCRDVEAHHLVEKRGGFGRGKAQITGAHFDQLPPGTQTGQWKSWVLTGDDDQVHVWGLMLDEKGEGLVNRFGIKQVVVVEDQDERL